MGEHWRDQHRSGEGNGKYAKVRRGATAHFTAEDAKPHPSNRLPAKSPEPTVERSTVKETK
jgi:hypothetical protein